MSEVCEFRGKLRPKAHLRLDRFVDYGLSSKFENHT
jgi:hypothetical protein